MATWKDSPSWNNFEDINGGQQFNRTLSPEDLNKLAENIAYLYEHSGESDTAEEWDGTGIVIAPTEDELAGTWVFKDIVNLSPLASSTDFYVNFTYGADNTESTAIRVLGGDYVEIAYQYYDDDEGEYVFSTAYYGLNGWYNGQTIHITSKLSDLADADGESLLAWLKANATKQ